MINLLGSVAEFKTAIKKVRQREGLEWVTRDGKKEETEIDGSDDVWQMRSEYLRASIIACSLEIGRTSVCGYPQ